MQPEFPCSYNFYGEIKNDTLPHNYETFIQLISGKYSFPPEDSKKLFFELETKQHEFKQINETNFENLSKLPIITVYIYFNENDLKSKKQKENVDIIEKEKENKQLNSIEDLITKKIKDLTAELVKETNMGISTILENSRFERIKEFEEKKENKKICVSIHNGVICNGCYKNPIKGLRYKCSICPQFNYCQKCEMKLGESHKHPFIKLRFEV